MRTSLHYYLAAAHISNISPRHFQQLLTIFPTMQSLFQAAKEELEMVGVSAEQIESLQHPDWRQVEQSFTWMQKDDCHIVALDDHRYPALLKEISDPPLVLFVRGNASILSRRQLGIVGSRAVSGYGSRNAQMFAAGLSRAGFVITSGLARGVDAAGHQGALSVHGLTIAVAGTGLNHTYPFSHRRLADDIVVHGGALVSEFPLSLGPKAYHFPRRNRIISGMSLGVLVVEAALKSGSLVTARHAVEQGREVFAIPGSIQSPVAAGCHALIRQGARLVEAPGDILDEFGTVSLPVQVEFSPTLVMIPETLNSDEQKIYQFIGSSAISMDEIILRSGLTASAVSSILLTIELQGHIQAVAGGYVKVGS